MFPGCRREASAPGFLLSFNQQDEVDVKLPTLSKRRSGASHGQDRSLVIRYPAAIEESERGREPDGQKDQEEISPVATGQLERVRLPIGLGGGLNIVVACVSSASLRVARSSAP